MKFPALMIWPVIVAASPAQTELGPGRCGGEFEKITVRADELGRIVLPYARCLTTAEQHYGFNDGPYAVSQCAHARERVRASIPSSKRSELDQLIKQIEDKFVWQVWCATDVGDDLPGSIKVRAGWPQYRSAWNHNAPNP